MRTGLREKWWPLWLRGGLSCGAFCCPRAPKEGSGVPFAGTGQKMRGTLDLSVYAENERAVAFYQKNGFRITGERIEEVTGRTELLMAFP